MSDKATMWSERIMRAANEKAESETGSSIPEEFIPHILSSIVDGYVHEIEEKFKDTPDNIGQLVAQMEDGSVVVERGSPGEMHVLNVTFTSPHESSIEYLERSNPPNWQLKLQSYDSMVISCAQLSLQNHGNPSPLGKSFPKAVALFRQSTMNLFSAERAADILKACHYNLKRKQK